MDYMDSVQLTDLLRKCPSIQELHYCVPSWMDHSYVPGSGAPLVLTYLRTLHIQFTDNENPLADVFYLLVIPILAEVTISGNSTKHLLPLYPASVLLLRSNPQSLRTLSFGSCGLSEDDLLQLLDITTSLESLTLHNITDVLTDQNMLTDRFLWCFLEADAATGRHTFLPNLRDFEYVGPCYLTWSVLADVIEAHVHHPRNAVATPLTSFVVSSMNHEITNDYIDVESLERFFAFPRNCLGENHLDLNFELMEKSMAYHGMACPYHDLGLYYFLPHAFALYNARPFIH